MESLSLIQEGRGVVSRCAEWRRHFEKPDGEPLVDQKQISEPDKLITIKSEFVVHNLSCKMKLEKWREEVSDGPGESARRI